MSSAGESWANLSNSVLIELLGILKQFFKNIKKGKAVCFFTSKKKKKTRNIYERYFQNEDKVCRVDADIKEEIKTKILEDFESVNSKTRVIIGTKDIANGLTCPSVEFICLADCQVDTIDYLQIIGKIQKGIYADIVAIEENIAPNKITEVCSPLDNMYWKECITKQIAGF